MDYIKLDIWPTDHAKKAYENGYFIEAIQVLHSWIECQSRSLLMLVGSIYFDIELSNIWDIIDTIAYKDVVKTLFSLGQLTKNDLNSLLELNSLRNKIIHQFIKEPYKKEYKGIPKKLYDRVFNQSLEYAEIISNKNEKIIEIQK